MTRQMQDALFCALAIGHVERHRNGGIAVVVAQRPSLDRNVDYPAVGGDVTAGNFRRLQSLLFAGLAVQYFPFLLGAAGFPPHRQHLLATISLSAASAGASP